MNTAKLNEDLCRAIWSAIGSGESLSSAAASAGVDRKTIYRWLRRGDDDQAAGSSTIYATLSEGVEHARTIARATKGVRKQVTRAYLAGVEDGRAQAVLGGAA